jgi:hypothetical protein
MKYFYSSILFFSFLASQAQLDIRLNVDDLLKKKAALNLEMGADKFSVELGTRFLYSPWTVIQSLDADGNPIGEETIIKRFGYVGSLRANFYTNPNTSIDGFHISPTLDYMRQTVKFDQPTVNNRVGASVLFGYKYVFGDSKFAAQVETGVGYWFFDKTKVKATGSKPEAEQLLEDVGLGLFKNLRSLRLPVNITVNYRIGE